MRALIEPVLLAQRLLPVSDLTLQPEAAFTFTTAQKKHWGGARYGWKMMGGKLVDRLAGIPAEP